MPSRVPDCRLVLLASPLLLALAGCAGSRSAPGAVTRLRIAHEADILSLDPAAFREAVTQSVLSNIYEGLVGFDRDMRLVPALAINWSAADEHTWQLELRPGVRFHDGTPLTAAAVKAALDRDRSDPASSLRGQLANIEAVEAIATQTLRLRTRRRDPLLLNTLGYILIARDTARGDGPAGYVGTGPYRLVSWERGRYVDTVANTDYWGGPPAIAEARFVTVEDGEAGIQALRRGDVDVLRYVPETLVGELRGSPTIELRSRPGLTSYYLWYDTRPAERGARNPFADLRVRQALSLAIDRREIVRRLGGDAVALDQLVQQGVFGHVGGLPELPFDVVKARALLKQAGYPDGFETKLIHRSGATLGVVVTLLQAMLGQIGIRLETESPEWRQVVAAWQQGRIPFLLAGWRFENGDASSFLRDCLYTRDATRDLGSSNAGFSNLALDRLIDENSEIFGEANRLRQYERVMQVALAEMPLVPLYTRYNVYGVARQVAWKPRLDGKLLAVEMALRP